MSILPNQHASQDLQQYNSHPFAVEINSINKNLEHILFNILTIENFSDKIIELSQKLINIIQKYPDMALANLMLNKEGLYAIRHSIDTAILGYTVASSMNKSQKDILSLIKASLTMNVSIIQEYDGMHLQESLTKAQKNLIYNHPTESFNLLKSAGVTDNTWLTHVLDHHICDIENYPESSKPRNKILESTKIIFIADRYCALISGRPYRKPYLPNSAIHFILTKGKNIIDPALAVCFIKVLGMYPPGTCVKLNNGETAIVSHKTVKKMFPIVYAINDKENQIYLKVIQRNTEVEHFKIREVLFLDTIPQIDFQQVWPVVNE